MKPYIATYDVTERDIATARYRQLQAEQALHNITRVKTKKASGWLMILLTGKYN